MKNAPYSRRNFIRAGTLWPLASAAASLTLERVAAAFAPIERVGGAYFKPALNAYSFLELLNARAKDPTAGIDLFEVCAFAARHDLDAVDLTGYFFPGYPKTPPDEYLAKIKHYTHNQGLVISGTGVRNDFTAADRKTRAEGVEHIKEWIETAARLGAPTVRVFADCQAPFKSWQEASGNADRATVEAWMADDLRACAEHAAKFGVLVAVQNHGDFIASGAEHLSLLRRVDHAWCGALVDTGKYMTDDPYADIALMAPHAVNWQIKETLHSRVDSPATDFKKLVTIVRKSGYRGYLPIETLSMHRRDYDPAAAVVKVLEEMRAAIAATAEN